jgi:hypothetical protein
MPNREQKLQRAVNLLTKYFGLYNIADLTSAIASSATAADSRRLSPGGGTSVQQQSQLQSVSGTPEASANTFGIAPDAILATILQLVIDTSEGSYTAFRLAKMIEEQMRDANEETKSRVRSLIQMYGTSDQAYREIQDASFPDELITISRLMNQPEGQNSIINGNQNSEPTKEKPGLSIIFSNSKRVSQTSRHANAVTIFMNGMPSVEMARAVPYLNIDFLFARPPISDDNRLQTPSLLKFLNGADRIPEGTENQTTDERTGDGSNSTYRSLVLANRVSMQVSRGRETTEEDYTTAGMEMFTAPQTLINANEIDNEQKRSNPVIDKFRPFMTIKDFEVNIVGTTGLSNYKTAKLTIVLHDRSRLADVADFVRPDLYGRTELLIEYGWSHPDGERNSDDNPYGQLINGMRCREKYGVVNSSYTFDDAGQVTITLSLAMRGGIDTSTEVISSNDESIGNALREVQDLQQIISEIRQRSFQQGLRTREIRGIQILDAAQDALAHTILNSDLRNELRTFRRTLANQATIPDVARLRTALDNLFGTESQLGSGRSRSGGSSARGALGQVRTSILQSISQKVARISSIPDPFVINNWPPDAPQPGASRQVGAIRSGAEARREQSAYMSNFETTVTPGAKTSLATLLLHFIGEPLANTHKFDDIQLLFYPFNSRAGFAAGLNIGNFEVDLSYFAQEFARVRLSNISRSANMNLREFMNFIAQTLIDDPAAKAYGLWNSQGAFYRETFDGGITRSTEAIAETPVLQQRMEERLRGITPDGTFDMPQLEFYIECLPEKNAVQDGVAGNSRNEKSILRIHIYDRKASAYESLGSLLASGREGELAAVGSIPGGQSGNPGVIQENSRDAAAFIAAAETYQLIEEIPNTDPRMYRIKGGPRKLKEFLYRTVPYMIYGAGGTLIKQANVSSQQNPELATVNMLRSFRRSELEPNGELPGGLPMRIIPSELTMQTVGCPLFVYTQQFFIDFQTGTSVDNIYGIIGITHKITEGDFTTDLKFAPFDAYGRYDSFMNRVFNSRQILASIEEEQQSASTAARTTFPTTIRRT